VAPWRGGHDWEACSRWTQWWRKRLDGGRLEEENDKRVPPVDDRGHRRERKRVDWAASNAGLRPTADDAHAGCVAKWIGPET
jgi:hypothetical protein